LATELAKLAGKFDDVTDKIDRLDAKIDRLVETTAEIKINCAQFSCRDRD